MSRLHSGIKLSEEQANVEDARPSAIQVSFRQLSEFCPKTFLARKA
jgi:hypothetical protein